jgi:hypothetical protein
MNADQRGWGLERSDFKDQISDLRASALIRGCLDFRPDSSEYLGMQYCPELRPIK